MAKPSIVTEGLEALTLQPAWFGRDSAWLLTGVGQLDKDRPVYVVRRAVGTAARARLLVQLLNECGYKNVRPVADIELRGTSNFGPRGAWRIKPGRVKSGE